MMPWREKDESSGGTPSSEVKGASIHEPARPPTEPSYDTMYGRFSKPVAVAGGDLVIEGRTLRTLRDADPLDLPWKELGVELVFECSVSRDPLVSSDDRDPSIPARAEA